MCTVSPSIASRAELRRVGYSRRDIDAALAAGTLERLRIGVYAHLGACATARTAALHGGPLACVSAAEHRDLWVLHDERVHVWLPRHGQSHAHRGCTCVTHWTKTVPAASAFGTPPVPHILRQILECQGIESFFVTLESALRTRRLTRAELAWLRDHVGATGRDAIDFARHDADSGLESLVRWRLRRHRLKIHCQVAVFSVGIVDFLIDDWLIIETDGADNHDDEKHRHKDLMRDASAAVCGYMTLRFDYAMVMYDWETVELAILAAIDHHNRSRT